jgi:hypothetical protein
VFHPSQKRFGILWMCEKITATCRKKVLPEF